jgi:hypothetical protein
MAQAIANIGVGGPGMGPMSGHRFRRAGLVAVLCAAAALFIFLLGRGARRDPRGRRSGEWADRVRRYLPLRGRR